MSDQKSNQNQSVNIPDEKNPDFLFSTTDAELLSKIVKGEIDPIQLAIRQLKARGLDIDGKWVGFNKW